MSDKKENQGLFLKDYQSKLPNNTLSLRIGKEVPEGDVNLAYIHTPKIQAEENISLIDTTNSADNSIPQDQLEAIVVANSQGELEYVNITGNGGVTPRPPRNIFPSNEFFLTRYFKKDEVSNRNALYYRFDINYHYDSMKDEPDENGQYQLKKYNGDQIELTDENGNLLDESYRYEIYVQATAYNPNIYSVRIYLHKNTDTLNTIMVRYNHIDRITKNEHVYSVNKQIEFYTNKENTIIVDNKERQMLEGGKLRIINATSAFTQVSAQELRNQNGQLDVYAIVPSSSGDGNKILVNQKAEADPRVSKIFSYRLIAITEKNGKTHKYSAGLITDWVMNLNSLLKREKESYINEWKNLGIPFNGVRLKAKDMIDISMSFDSFDVPYDVTYYIEDSNGNLLYNVTSLVDNTNIKTQVNKLTINTVEAKPENLPSIIWENGNDDNVILKSNPFYHTCSIIAERQKMSWDFKWTLNGSGKTGTREDWLTNNNNLTIEGSGIVEFHADGHFTYSLSPKKIPNNYIPDEIYAFTWDDPVVTQGKNISMYLDDNNNIVVNATPEEITRIGTPYILNETTILKSEEIKKMEYLFDTDGELGFYEKLNIPGNIPKDEILLRIERGSVISVLPNGNANSRNADYRVNYRFRCRNGGTTRLPVDQFQNQLGVNRLRLKSIVDKSGNFKEDFIIDVVAWTTFEELESAPVFALKIEEDRKIKIEKPRLEPQNQEYDNWYLRIKNGKFLRRIQLPHVGNGSKVPEIYVSYPQLLDMVNGQSNQVEVDLEYNVTEYTNQEFHNRPIVIIDKEVPTLLNEYAIQTKHSPIMTYSETGQSFISVYSMRSGQQKKMRISDVDTAKGIIYLHDRIREQDNLFVSYAYKEEWFNYRGFNSERNEIITVEKEIPVNVVLDTKINASVSYETIDVVRITIDQGSSLELALNPTKESTILTGTVYYTDGTVRSVNISPGDVSWSGSGCTNVLEVKPGEEKSAIVTALGRGSCNITVRYTERGITVTDTINIKTIGNAYNIAVRLRWGYTSARNMDLDLYAFIDDDYNNKSVGFKVSRVGESRPYQDGENMLVLNYDYTDHKKKEHITSETEIVTINKFVGNKITISVENYSNYSLNNLTGGESLEGNNKAQIEIYDRETKKNIKIIEIPPSVFNSSKLVKVCEFVNKAPGLLTSEDINVLLVPGSLS